MGASVTQIGLDSDDVLTIFVSVKLGEATSDARSLASSNFYTPTDYYGLRCSQSFKNVDNAADGALLGMISRGAGTKRDAVYRRIDKL